MRLTKKHIAAGKSYKGGYNRHQVKALGLSYPLKKGWLKRMVGAEITAEAYSEFLKNKDRHLKKSVSEADKVRKSIAYHQLQITTLTRRLREIEDGTV